MGPFYAHCVWSPGTSPGMKEPPLRELIHSKGIDKNPNDRKSVEEQKRGSRGLLKSYHGCIRG